MRTNKSMLDEAYDIVVSQGAPMAFMDLMNVVATNLEMTEEEKMARLGNFYTDLLLDGRFVALTDNTWDLRERHIFDKVHIDVNEVYTEEEGEPDLEDMDEEEKMFEEGEGASFEVGDGEEGTRREVDLEGTGMNRDDF